MVQGQPVFGQPMLENRMVRHLVRRTNLIHSSQYLMDVSLRHPIQTVAPLFQAGRPHIIGSQGGLLIIEEGQHGFEIAQSTVHEDRQGVFRPRQADFFQGVRSDLQRSTTASAALFHRIVGVTFLDQDGQGQGLVKLQLPRQAAGILFEGEFAGGLGPDLLLGGLVRGRRLRSHRYLYDLVRFLARLLIRFLARFLDGHWCRTRRWPQDEEPNAQQDGTEAGITPRQMGR